MRRATRTLACLLALGIASGWFGGIAHAQSQFSGPEGILILTGPPESATAFNSIAWVDTSGGYVTDASGTKTPFATSEIGRIIYFDQAYYDEVDHLPNWVGWRAGVQNRETVLAPLNNISLSSADLAALQSQAQFLSDTEESYSTSKPLLAPFLAPLQDVIAKLSSGLVLRNGQWMTQKQADSLSTADQSGGSNQPVTFKTKDGKTYTNVQVTMTDTGLSIVTSDGGATVPFYQLPDDLSPFPAELQAKIYAVEGKNPSGQFIPSGAPGKGFFASSAGGIIPSAKPANGPPPALNPNAVVLIKGDSAQGTGFLAKTPGGPVVVTNLHVIASNPNLKIFTVSGQQIIPLSLKGASDRDLAMFAIQDNNYSYLDLATDVDQTAQTGDDAIVPGNSEGGEVTLKTNGYLLGIGPQRIEFSNPVFHGNSGGPVYDVKIGKVIAVASFAVKVTPQDEVDSNSLANANSAIKGGIRYFGWRLDTVPDWEPYDQNHFVNEGLFLKDFDDVNRALDVFLNGKQTAESHVIPDSTPGHKYEETAQKIIDAFDKYHDAVNDSTDKQSAALELIWTLSTMADEDYSEIRDTNSFYKYNQPLAKYELDYRDQLKSELSEVQSKVNSLTTAQLER